MPARFARLLGERFRAPYPRAIHPIPIFAVMLRPGARHFAFIFIEFIGEKARRPQQPKADEDKQVPKNFLIISG